MRERSSRRVRAGGGVFLLLHNDARFLVERLRAPGGRSQRLRPYGRLARRGWRVDAARLLDGEPVEVPLAHIRRDFSGGVCIARKLAENIAPKQQRSVECFAREGVDAQPDKFKRVDTVVSARMNLGQRKLRLAQRHDLVGFFSLVHSTSRRVPSP